MIEYTYTFYGGDAVRIFEKFSRFISAVLILSLCACGICSCESTQKKPHQLIIEEKFNTTSVIYDYSGGTRSRFYEVCGELSELLDYYHELFDIYNTYEGVTNLAYVNSMAGKGAVKVDSELVDFLEFSKEMHTLTNGYVNIAMGAVLSIWHDCREAAEKNPSAARVPSEAELAEAAKHCNIDDLVIDKENMTVELLDPEMSLDVGAIGKGYATERLAEHLASIGVSSYALDIGGNLRVVGTKPDGSGWRAAVENPLVSNGTAIYKFEISDSSAVTSGRQKRFYTVDGVDYHHIISKDTLYPARCFASVTVLCRDSGYADALSTAMFCMDYDTGRAFAQTLDGVEIVWVFDDGRVEKLLKSK